MNKKDLTYWEKRQKRKYLAGEKKLDEYYKGLQKAFEQAKKEIQSVINDFYMRYAKENKVSYAEAQKLLNKAEIGELQEFIDLVNESLGEYNLKLTNMSIKARITRYQALEKQIDAILQRLYALEYEYKGKELLKEVYTDSYYRTWFNIDQYHGFHQEFARVNPRTIDELIKYPFNGADFSSRIWKQKDHMLQVLTEDITTMLVQGKNPQTLAGDFAKRFKTKEYEAYRLLHTESSFIIEQGALAAYKEDGVERYQILATLDHKTSEICREQDGEIYEIDKATVGVNYPPFHPFCRTTTVPYYEDEDEVGTRAARDPKTGKTYYVPSNMKYKEWKEKFVDGTSEEIEIKAEYIGDIKEVEKWEKKYFGDWVKSLSKEEKEAFEYYTMTGGAQQINDYLRAPANNKPHIDEPFKKAISLMKNALKRATVPHDIMVHRSVSYNWLGEELKNELFTLRENFNVDKLVGKEFIEKGFTSTSLIKGTFGQAISINIQVPKGMHAAAIEDVSVVSNEHELLFPPGLKIKVVSAKLIKETGRIEIDAAAIKALGKP